MAGRAEARGERSLGTGFSTWNVKPTKFIRRTLEPMMAGSGQRGVYQVTPVQETQDTRGPRFEQAGKMTRFQLTVAQSGFNQRVLTYVPECLDWR